MKRAILSLFTVCLLFSCEKEQKLVKKNSDNQQVDQSSNSSNGGFTMKSGSSDMDDLALAANIASITWNGTNSNYEVDSHDDTLDYTVDIDVYQPDSSIEFSISVSSGTPSSYDVEIDVDNQTIDISNVGTFTFKSYYGKDGVTPPEGTIKNMVAAISAFHGMNPYGSDSWDDNGDDDDFAASKPFIGKTVTYGPCNEILHLQNQTTKIYVFWIEVSSNTESVPC